MEWGIFVREQHFFFYSLAMNPTSNIKVLKLSCRSTCLTKTVSERRGNNLVSVLFRGLRTFVDHRVGTERLHQPKISGSSNSVMALHFHCVTGSELLYRESLQPPSGEYGTNRTVWARSWPRRSGKSPHHVSRWFLVCSAAVASVGHANNCTSPERPALRVGSNHLFQIPGLYWSSPESGDLCYKSRQLEKMF